MSTPVAAPPLIRRMADDFERPPVAMIDPGWTTAKAELVPVNSAMRKSGFAIIVQTVQTIIVFIYLFSFSSS